MAENSLQILQGLRNRVDTAGDGWLAWAEACTPRYEAALKIHKDTLDAAKLLTTANAELAWTVLSIMLTVAGAAWVPRLLKPVESLPGEIIGFDELAASWVADAVKAGGSEVKSALSGTALDRIKNFVGKTSDAFEPVVETTTTWSSRLKEGIYTRSKAVKTKLDAVVDQADRWTVSAAASFRRGFETGCPFLTDEPKDIGETFKTKFQDDSELAMWIEWAIQRDEPYWINAESGGVWDPYAVTERHALDPIRRRLIILGVPHDVTKGTFGGQSGHPSSWAPPLDMVVFIRWAKNKSLNEAAKHVCKRVEPSLLQLRREPPANVCRVQ
jgi:hypothetical protein